MVREKRTASQSPLAGPETQFKRLRDQDSFSGLIQARSEHAAAHPSCYESHWVTRALMEDQWHNKNAVVVPYSQPESMSYLPSALSGSRTTQIPLTMPPSETMVPAPSEAYSISMQTPQTPLNLNRLDRPEPTDESRARVNPSNAHNRQATDDPESSDLDSEPTYGKTRVTHSRGSVEIGNVEALKDYFMSRFCALLVNPCKPIAARLVEALCPGKKQAFPYMNPSKPDLFNGRPSWWPVSVEYRSPHHMRKNSLLTFLSHVLTLPLTNQTELQDIFEEGQFHSWKQLLDSTLPELDLHDSKYLPSDPEKREFDEQRHQGRMEALKEMYRISGLAADCAEGVYDRDFKIQYKAVPYVCFRETSRKKIRNLSPDDTDEGIPPNTGPGLVLNHRKEERNNTTFDVPDETQLTRSWPHGSTQSLVGAEDDKVKKPKSEERNKMDRQTPIQKWVKAVSIGDAWERLDRGEKDSSWPPSSWLEPALPNATAERGHGADDQITEFETHPPKIPLSWTKADRPNRTVPAQEVSEVSTGRRAAWKNKFETGNFHQTPVSQPAATQLAQSYNSPVPTCNVDFYLGRSMSPFASTSPRQDSQYYSSAIGQEAPFDRMHQIAYWGPPNTSPSWPSTPEVASSNAWIPPIRSESVLHHRERA